MSFQHIMSFKNVVSMSGIWGIWECEFIKWKINDGVVAITHQERVKVKTPSHFPKLATLKVPA